MTVSPNEMLRMLGSSAGLSARPAGHPVTGAVKPIEQTSFAELLKKVEGGKIASDLPITVEPDAGVQLSDEQLTRLGAAADAAEASGVRNALVLIDGMALVLDVQSRSITRSVDLSSGVTSGIDGVVSVPGAGSGDATVVSTGAQGTLAGMPGNPSLLNLLASARPAEATRHEPRSDASAA